MALLTCDDAGRSTIELLRGLFVRMDDGSFAMKTTTVAGGDPMECNESEIPTQNIVRGGIVRVGGVLAMQIQPTA